MTSYARKEALKGVKASLPLLFAFAPYGLVLGAQASQKGLSLTEVWLMTALNFAGGSEFAAIQLWETPLPAITIIAITFLINSRYIIMGAAIAPYFERLPRKKVLPALFFMTDAGWAMTYAEAQKRSLNARDNHATILPFYLGACLPIYPLWVGFSVLGRMVGPYLGDVDSYGFAIAFPAVFLVLLRGMWKSYQAARPWLVSLIVAALIHILVPGPWFVLGGTFAGMVAAYLWGKES